MPRYYFQVSGQSTFTDTRGVELADDAAAWSMAVASCGELVTDLAGKLGNGSGIAVTVEAGRDRVVAVVQVKGELRTRQSEPTP